jgi:tetratricopeptide (TPR) repeat protein
MELRASAFHRNSPFHPVRGLLKEAFLLGEDDAPEEQVARLEMALEQTGLPVDECLPLMAELLGLPLPVDHPPLELAPELQRQQTLEMLCAWIFGLAEQQPLVLIVEDLHWADPSTIELVGLLVAQVPMVPVLLIITQRPDFEPSFASQPHLAVLPLNALSQKHVDSMVASLAGGKTVPRNIRDHVLERADGVPLFIEELTRSVLESDLLEEGDTGWETTDPLPHFAVPDTLQDTLEARLDRLGPAREIAQLAAAIGRDFSQALLAEVSGMDPAELDEQLADLVEAGLVHRRGLPPRAHYAFKHALIQETAYLAMLPETRKLYHARIARTLERATGSPSAVEPDGIARHYAQAGRLTEAVTAYETAGRQANSRSASLEAIAHYRAALAALVEQPPGAQRDLREVGLQVALGEPMVSALGSGNVEVEATYARARELSQDLNATIGLADALDGLVTFYITQSRLDEAVEFASQQLDVAEVLNSDELRIRAHFSLAIIHYFLGDASKALGHFEQIDAIFDPALHRELVTIRGENIGAVSRAWCSWTLWMLGLPDQALAAATTGVQRARDVGNPFSVAFALAWQTGVHWNCRQIDDCAKSANACIEVSEKRGFPIPLGIARLALLRCVGGTEDADRRIAEAESALVSLGATGTQIAVPQILGGLADFCLDCGRPDTAAAYIDAAFALSERTGQPHWDSELYRCKGEVLLAQDPTNHEKAEALFRRAVGTAADQRARMLELRTTTRLCQLLHETGRSDEARERLSKIYGQFGEGLGLPDLKAARGLLDTLG